MGRTLMPNETKLFTGVLKVTNSSSLESYTQQGWKVLDFFDEESVESRSGSEPRGYPEGNSSYDAGTVSTERNFVVRTRRFLLGWDETSQLAKSAKALEEASRAVETNAHEKRVLQQEIVALQEKVQLAKGDCEGNGGRMTFGFASTRSTWAD